MEIHKKIVFRGNSPRGRLLVLPLGDRWDWGDSFLERAGHEERDEIQGRAGRGTEGRRAEDIIEPFPYHFQLENIKEPSKKPRVRD